MNTYSNKLSFCTDDLTIAWMEGNDGKWNRPGVQYIGHNKMHDSP